MNKAKDSARQGANFDKILHIELLLPCVWRGKTRGFSDSQENLGGWDSLTTQSRSSEGYLSIAKVVPVRPQSLRSNRLPNCRVVADGSRGCRLPRSGAAC